MLQLTCAVYVYRAHCAPVFALNPTFCLLCVNSLGQSCPYICAILRVKWPKTRTFQAMPQRGTLTKHKVLYECNIFGSQGPFRDIHIYDHIFSFFGPIYGVKSLHWSIQSKSDSLPICKMRKHNLSIIKINSLMNLEI